MIDYPYMISNNKIAPIIAKIQEAAKPPKLTQEVLKKIGFSSTNDRAVIPLLKRLEFLSEDGVPTAYYDQLRDKTTSKIVMANRIRALYSDIFSINTNIYNDSEANVKGAISRVTGKDEASVTRYYNTFKVLCSIADFDGTSFHEDSILQDDEKESIESSATALNASTPAFHYNIQIHLPATTDISVYNAIFKSLKDNLVI